MIRRCPLCRRETSWEENLWKPFCSERCQMVDLGRWSSEDYRVPLAETEEGLAADLVIPVSEEGRTINFDRESSTDE